MKTSVEYQQVKTNFPFLSRVFPTGIIRRGTSSGARRVRTWEEWEHYQHKNKPHIVIGYRYLWKGEVHYYEDHVQFEPTANLLAVLLVRNERCAPVYAKPSQLMFCSNEQMQQILKSSPVKITEHKQ